MKIILCCSKYTRTKFYVLCFAKFFFPENNIPLFVWKYKLYNIFHRQLYITIFPSIKWILSISKIWLYFYLKYNCHLIPYAIILFSFVIYTLIFFVRFESESHIVKLRYRNRSANLMDQCVRRVWYGLDNGITATLLVLYYSYVVPIMLFNWFSNTYSCHFWILVKLKIKTFKFNICCRYTVSSVHSFQYHYFFSAIVWLKVD